MPPRRILLVRLNFLRETPLHFGNRNWPPRHPGTRHLMPLAGFDLVMTPPNPDINRMVNPHPNMALVGDAAILQVHVGLLHRPNLLREIALQNMGHNGLNILHVGPLLPEFQVMVLPNRNHNIPPTRLTPEVNLDVHGPNRIRVAAQHIPPNQNAPPNCIFPREPVTVFNLRRCPILQLPPEVNLDVRRLNRIRVAAQHIPPNQNVPPRGPLVPVQQGPHVLVVSGSGWDKAVPSAPDTNHRAG